MSKKVDVVVINFKESEDFPVDDSVFNTDTGVVGIYGPSPPPSLPTSEAVTITDDTEYEFVSSPVASQSSVMNGITFDYDTISKIPSKLVFKGWGSVQTLPSNIDNNNFNFSSQPISLVFGNFLKLTGNTFNLGAGSTLQLTQGYSVNSNQSEDLQKGFINNTVTLGYNSQFSLVLDDSYHKAYPDNTNPASYRFVGNTLTLGDNVNFNLSIGKDVLETQATIIYSDNTFYLGNNNVLTFGESSYSTHATNNIIYAGTGSTINFESNHSDAYNTLQYGTYINKKSVQSLNQYGYVNKNVWDSSNKIIYNTGVKNVTINVGPGFIFNQEDWDTGIDGIVNFSGIMNGPSASSGETSLTNITVADGSSFNISGETVSINRVTFKLGKGSSLSVASDVLLPTVDNYGRYFYSTGKDKQTGTIINTDSSSLYNSMAGIFNSTVSFQDGDQSTTLKIGNLSLKGGKEITYLLNINGLDDDHGRILLENLNGFHIDTVTFHNQSEQGAAINTNAYVTINFINDAGEKATLNLKMDVHGELNIIPVNDGSGNVVSYYLSVCFNQGTLIKTINGEKAVELLARGDLIETKDGIRAVIWIGHKIKQLNRFSKKEDFLVLIKKDALGDNIPSKDLRITAEHCLYINDKLIPARMFVNGRSIVYDFEMTDYTIWHVECAKHQVIFAENVAVESYLDTGNRYTFDGCNDIISLSYNNKWTSEAVADLCTETSFVKPIWEQFYQRSIDLNFPDSSQQLITQTSPNIYICTDEGQVIYPDEIQGQIYIFNLDKATDFVSIMSYVSRPEDIYGSFVDDRRELGIAVSSIQLVSSDGEKTAVDYHLSTKSVVGWYDLENENVQYRWTKGCAYLPVKINARRDHKYILRLQVISSLPKYYKKTVKYDFLFKKVS